MKRVLKLFNHIVTILLFVLLITVAGMVLMTNISGGEPEIFGYQLKTVLSGSMEPDIQTGSIIVVEPGGDMTRFDKNDIITFRDEDKDLTTHRIVEVEKSGEHTMYQTKGDNNDVPDTNPVLSDNVVAEYTGYSVPYIGYLTNYAQSKNGALLLLLPGVLLLLYSIVTIWKALSKISITEDKVS